MTYFNIVQQFFLAMFSFLHLATFENGTLEGSSASNLADCLDLNPGSLTGAYDELFAIQKSSTFIEPVLPSHRHAGYIVSSFKILDRTCRVSFWFKVLE